VAHTTMAKNAVFNGLVDADGVWNDASLYDFEDEWNRVLLRVPELCDRELQPSEVEDAEDAFERTELQEDLPVGDRDALEQWLWSHKVTTRLYVRGREDMASDKIKVFYLNDHGDAIWHHKFQTAKLLEFDGAWHSMNLAEINGAFSDTLENGSELHI
jgi:hypothetical protein